MDFSVNVLRNVHIGSDDVHQGQRIAVFIGIDGVVERNVLRGFAVIAKVHEDLIIDTAGGVARQLDIFVDVKGIDRLNQTDRTDRYKIVLTAVVLIILFDDMRD